MAERIAGYKFEDGDITIHFARTSEELTAQGCLPLERAERPKDGKKYQAKYEEIDGVIHQTWEEVKNYEN